MKRLVIVAMLIVGTISFSGCANGPIRSWLRGARCGSDCAAPAHTCGTCGSVINGGTNSSFYGGYESSTCSECGSSLASPDFFDGGAFAPPTTGPLPAPGPQN